MSDDPSNAASRFLRNAYASLSERGSPSEQGVRAALTDDFAYEDRHRGVNFPTADAESYPKILRSAWQTGAGGQPRIETETLAVRGERFAALAVTIDYGNGMLRETIHVIALDATLSLVQRGLDFDVDDIDGALAELDRLHCESEAR